MNNIIFPAIRAAMVLGVALFAFVGSAWAAPVLTPATVKNISENSATIIGHVANPYKNSTVWFEFYNAQGVSTTYAVQSIWNDGTFEWNLDGLNKGQTYSYRSAAMEGGVTVYSPMSSFTTLVPKTITTSTLSSGTTSNNSTAGTPSTTQTTTTVKSTQTTTQAATTATSKQSTTYAPVATTDGFNNGKSTDGFNNNGASVLGAGNTMLPNTLVGWILLLIMMLVAVLIGHMIYEHAEERKEAREQKKKQAENANVTE